MRLPFMQLESDLLAHGAPQVGALAGCTPIQALGHIAYLRAWAVAQATDEAPPDGWARGPDAADAIEAAACWGGEPGRLLRALKVAKIIVVTPDGVQVQGMEPYAKAWEQNAKAKERMRVAREQQAKRRAIEAERSANSGVTGPNVPRNDGERPAKFEEQTQTQTQKEEASLSAGADEPEELPDATDDAHPVVHPPEPATQTMANAIADMPEATREPFALTEQSGGKKEPKPSAAQRLYAALEKTRQARCEEAGLPFIEQRWDARRINAMLSADAKVPKGQPLGPDGQPLPTEAQQRFEAAWGEYLADEDGATKEPPWSIGWFMSGGVRARYETRAVKAGAA